VTSVTDKPSHVNRSFPLPSLQCYNQLFGELNEKKHFLNVFAFFMVLSFVCLTKFFFFVMEATDLQHTWDNTFYLNCAGTNKKRRTKEIPMD
jgi:hypothetical protein